MPDRPEPKPWTHPGRLAVFIVTLLAPLLLSSCASVEKKDSVQWDHAFTTNNSTEVVSIPGCTHQYECLGNIGDGRWEQIAKDLNKPTMFDELALKWIADRRNHLASAIDGFEYFTKTWKTASRKRTDETILTLTDLIQEFECSAVLKEQDNYIWTIYINALDVILTPEFKANTLKHCFIDFDAWIFAQATDTNKSRAPSPNLLILWIKRLDQRPAPSDELIAAVDQVIFEKKPVIRHSKEFYERIEQLTPISLANLLLLLHHIPQKLYPYSDVLVKVFKRPEINQYRDELDQAWLDAFTQETTPRGVSKVFIYRLTLLDTLPMNSGNF